MSVNCATTEGTNRYSERFADRAANDHFRQQHDLVLSSIGIGTYLGNPDENTAANYRFQRSERSIGTALQTLANEHGIARDELVICTKGGYLPFDGAPPRNMREYVEDN